MVADGIHVPDFRIKALEDQFILMVANLERKIAYDNTDFIE